MNSTDLDYFRVVAETGGVREASRHLNVAPSAVSRRVVRLEAGLGTTLLDRTAAGTVLTVAGRRFLTYIHEVQVARQQLLDDLQAASQLESGCVYVCCTEGQLELISRAVSDFQQRYPKVSFDLKLGSAQAVLKAVESGDADLGIAFSPRFESPLESAVQLRAPLLVIVEPTHSLAALEALSLKDLAGYALALPPADFAIRRIVDQVARKQHVELHMSLHTDSIAAMKTFVLHHGGVTILSYMSVTPELHAGTLVAIPFEEDELTNTKIEVCVLGRRRLPPAVATFLRYLRVHTEPQMLSQWMAPSAFVADGHYSDKKSHQRNP